ncbi:Zinc finger BED domain-containing protein 4 [Larimichthys crocea]|uniref:Zinc finger BED domain-containing protein 4 n=1 Tax=Larimichthys crocea TaxID=215358 RepID=A0A6G0IZN2_LARCR|nr:Zinc finger BED domain-containing protein 4 [Larimichthys crocea]
MQKAMRDADFPGLPCMAHTLQLAVHEGILSQRSISDIVASGRRIVGHFKHSPLAYSRLEFCQKQLGQPIKKLRQDVPTRWNSSFYMLQSLLEQKLALASYAAENELPCNFTVHQWKLIENTITILAPFEELTKEISTSTASTADVVPCVRALTRLLEKTAETDHGVKTAKSVLLEAVRRRFADIDAQKLYTISTMLDPRYKDRYFSEALKPSFHVLLQNTLETSHPVHITTSTVEQPSSSKSTDKTPPACSLQAMFAEFVDEVAGHSEQEITIITQDLWLSAGAGSCVLMSAHCSTGRKLGPRMQTRPYRDGRDRFMPGSVFVKTKTGTGAPRCCFSVPTVLSGLQTDLWNFCLISQKTDWLLESEFGETGQHLDFNSG